jgi:predicted nucleic acid-binding protein
LVSTHLVDSDWTIDYLNGSEAALTRLGELARAGVLATSVVVVGEVREGAVGNDGALAQHDEFLQSVEILDVDYDVSLIYAELRSSLRKAGQLMSDNDLWIAATALRHNLTLMSRDAAFDRIPDLKLLR